MITRVKRVPHIPDGAKQNNVRFISSMIPIASSPYFEYLQLYDFATLTNDIKRNHEN